MTHSNLAYFAAAKAVSKLSDHKRYKIGAVVVMNHRIISSASNSDSKTHPLQKKYDKYRFTEDGDHKRHAELGALVPLIHENMDLSSASMYVYREHKDNGLGMARPCKSCMQLIKDVGIKKIFYTTEDGYAYERLR